MFHGKDKITSTAPDLDAAGAELLWAMQSVHEAEAAA